MEPQKSGLWKFALWFMAIIVLGIAVFVGVRMYHFWKVDRELGAFNKALENEAARMRDAQMKDTYGGKTPQETLSLYIEAVEKGDYELASKYFILEKQEGELRSLQKSSQENIDNVTKLLKEDLHSAGTYSQKRDGYVVRKPLLVDFMLYPTGLWKIIEI